MEIAVIILGIYVGLDIILDSIVGILIHKKYGLRRFVADMCSLWHLRRAGWL